MPSYSRLKFRPAQLIPPPEPVRDWHIGPISGHRIYVFFLLVAGIVFLYLLQDWLWKISQQPRNIFQLIYSYGTVLWISQVIPVGMGLAGLIIYRHPKHLDHVESIDVLVCFRIVSRGINTQALEKTINSCLREMSRTPLFPFIVEVVIDTFDEALPKENKLLRYVVVPTEYKTKTGALYKARALHYAVEHSPLPDHAWLVHLDEETHLTSSGIKGIATMIRQNLESGTLKIGQGPILYHRKWEEHPFLTLADSIRTGDDFARFYLQHKLGITIFGLHGSYIVVRNDVEKSIGFDFGPNGSITEDAFWALVAMEHGYRCTWVDGYLEEQSTESTMDFLKQRRRWFQGLAKVTLYAPVKAVWRISLGLNTILWALAPFSLLYTFVHFFYGFSIPGWIHFFANFSFAFFAALYLIGLKANMDEHHVRGFFRRSGWVIAQILLIPIFSIMEAIGILMAIFKPHPGFHVVKK